MTNIEQTILIAFTIHKDDMYGDKPYMAHLNDVYNVACEFNMPDDVREAAWLHDTIEDHSECVEWLYRQYPKDSGVLSLVEKVTDRPGKNRREREERTIPLIARSSKAVALKLCDLISNLRKSISENNSGKMKMYHLESSFIRDCFEYQVERNPELLLEIYSAYRAELFTADTKY